MSNKFEVIKNENEDEKVELNNCPICGDNKEVRIYFCGDQENPNYGLACGCGLHFGEVDSKEKLFRLIDFWNSATKYTEGINF